MNRVSPEFLGLILGKNVYWICNGSPENKIGYSSDCEASISGRAGYSVNTYEFMHMCKQWAVKKKWIMKSGINKEGKGFCEGLFGCLTADTEPEAVIKACEFIRGKEEVYHVNLP